MFHILKRYIFLKDAPKAVKISALVTILGIASAISVLIVALSVAAGFESEYKRSMLDFNAHVMLLKSDGEISDYNSIMSDLKKFDGLVGLSPFLYRESMAISKGIVKGVVIKGVDFGLLPKVSNLSIKSFSGRERAIIGKALADKFGITSETEISILTGPDKFQKIEIDGTFESGLYDYDSQFIFMPIPSLQKLFGMEDDKVTGIEMKLVDPDDAEEMTAMISNEFVYPYNVTNWKELNRPIFEAVRLEKIMFAIIVGALSCVALFNIIGALTLRIIYKAKEIAILSALGMKKLKVRALFTFHGLMLGFSGIAIGLLIGVICAWAVGKYKLINIEPEIYFLQSLPIKIEWQIVFIIGSFGLFVAWFVALMASMKMSALNITDSLKRS